jgi:uncharacterized protein
MRKRQIFEKISRFFKLIYIKLIKIDDSPHKIAIGFGLGVFAGVMPFAGPFVAVFLAIIFKVNKISAFLGGLITNTWITVLAFLFSIKVGSFLFRLDGNIIRDRWMALLKDFHLANFFKLSVLEIALPVLTGYIVLAFFSAIAAYGIIFIVLKIIKYKKKV